MDNLDYSTYPDYNDFMERVRTTLGSSKRQNAVSDPLLVAQVIYKATTDQKTTLRYRAGADAQQLWFLRRLL